eukprot:TRINITY_DN2192_c0_g1_i1.p2 TRINITY_DN2192_c0_g1~~TRINITY_DN2192_c0_g1_i1.p2  ORF type:complete len:222 (-),score=161.33 TRINITY_DN2192_c0_g1_i1:58-723(-)
MSLTLQQEMLPAQVECALARLLRAPAERFAATNDTSSERKRSTAHGVTIFDTDDENETSAEGLVDRFASLVVNGTDDAFAAAGFGTDRPAASKGAAVTASPTPVPTADGTGTEDETSASAGDESDEPSGEVAPQGAEPVDVEEDFFTKYQLYIIIGGAVVGCLLLVVCVCVVKKCRSGDDDDYGSGYYGSEMGTTATAPTPMKGKLEVEWIDEDSDEDLLV